MRILYINKSFSGQMEQLAYFIAKRKSSVSAFMAERWRRDAQLPGGMLVRIPAPDMPTRNVQADQSEEQLAENLATRMMQNAFAVKNSCLRLRHNGFFPDIIYTTSQDGYAFLLKSVFPKARLVVRLNWVQMQRHAFASPENEQIKFLIQDRINAIFQLDSLCNCEQSITSSYWQKAQLPKELWEKICVVGNGINSQFFVPELLTNSAENIIFSCQGKGATHGINTLAKSLPGLLTLRPNCRIFIVSFALRKSKASLVLHAEELSRLLPSLTEAQQQRVRIVSSPTPLEYRTLLQQAKVYVYLTTPTLLSTGLMEAMSCGALVLASDTEPVREIIQADINGLLWTGKDAESLAFEVSEACTRADELQALRKQARETILARYEIRNILLQHTKAVLGDFV